MRHLLVFLLSISLFFSNELISKPKEKEEKKDTTDKFVSSTFSGLNFRLIGPAATSGRVGDFAVNPKNKSEFYVAISSGNVWKTTNKGVSFTPIFDSYGSYSIGCLALDPNNPFVVWVGTGENNSQRSVGYGDGIYKSTDGGKSFTNMGLKKSEHIGKILIDPRNSDVIYVAAQGPLWGPGGDRGLYKSTDGGKTWEQSLKISENTGVTDAVFDPRNPDVIFCASYQRRRHVWTLINGGPESAIYKSTDAGKTWNKLTSGLPSVDMGKIGLAIPPTNPDIVYATIEAASGQGGFYKSTDRGASWNKVNSFVSGSAQYYQEIVCDPMDENVVYNLDTYTHVTYDGGKTFVRLSNKYRHVDDHALWIDPDNNNYLIMGGDGGAYESYDRGETWRFFQNLPTTQYYRVTPDNSEPFYYVYGGTQDNNTWGGPSRTTNSGGITNEDWFMVVGGDGYKAQIDPKDPNIVYGQWQYGNLVRFDRKSGEVFYIQPQPEKGEELRWNWDTPLILSHHSNTRLYIAANRVFRSDDRGQSWKAISPDLTRRIDRNQLPVMGKIWGPDAVAKSASTSFYGNIIALVESPLNENLIIVGTDDGLLQITEDEGKNWRKIDKFPGVPETTYVSDIFTSQFNENVIYVTFNNHKNNDFKPYVIKSTDKGATWKLISSNLPENGPVWTINEDHKNPNLLFVGTEFGAFFTINGGEKWIQFKSGLPTIAVRDIEIQRRENDLILGTFGRGIYILDDYTPLRTISKELFDKSYHIFPIKDALMYNEDDSRSKNDHGETFYRAKNPPFGATFTFYVKEKIKTLREKRIEEEKKLEKEGKPINYPTPAQLKAEDEELKPYLIAKIMDEEGNTIRLLTTSMSPGINRLTWDLRYPDTSPVDDKTDINKSSGMAVMPGKYKIVLAQSVDGVITVVSDTADFIAKVLENTTLPPKDRKSRVEFQKKVARMQNAVFGANNSISALKTQLGSMKNAFMLSPNVKKEAIMKVTNLEKELEKLNEKINGDKSLSKRNENQPPSINDRLMYILWGIWGTSSEQTKTQIDAYNIAGDELEKVLTSLRNIAEKEIIELNKELDNLGSPWTPGRIPNWKKE